MQSTKGAKKQIVLYRCETYKPQQWPAWQDTHKANGEHHRKPQLDSMQRLGHHREPSANRYIYTTAPAFTEQGPSWKTGKTDSKSQEVCYKTAGHRNICIKKR